MLSHRRLSALATAAVVLLWGGILVIAAIERRLPADDQWIGHAGVHLWTAANAALITAVAFSARRRGRIGGDVMRWAVGLTGVLAAIVVVTGLLDAVGAYPPASAIHDPVNAIAAPAGWLLLGSLALVVVVGLTERASLSGRSGAA